jgi:pimeloyl-ACP methyl ester carboxylesterase
VHGGPIAIVREGETITIDVDSRRIDLDLPDEEIEARLQDYEPPEIEVPTLIVWGRNDVLIPVEDAYEYERLIGANARAVVFDDTGHLAMVERPSRFNELLAGFIAEPEPAAPGG